MRQTTIDGVKFEVLSPSEHNKLNHPSKGRARKVEINVGNKPKVCYYISVDDLNKYKNYPYPPKIIS
jgi:hypothetical protein|tara:strand:+ start:106 stop:306 length:201 start_codon:yes stop_codon:yes gene_type:complete